MIGDEEDFFVPKREGEPRPYPEEDRQADEEYFRKKLYNALQIPEHLRMDTDELIKKTFEELRITGFKPWRDLLIVRTHPIPQRTGMIFLPAKLTTFYGELPHMQPITATVIAAGPKCDAKVGDRVAFMRLYFAAWQFMENFTVVGWIKESDVIGFVDLDPGDTFADLRVESTVSRRLH